MLRKIKYGKIAIVLFITVLIWVWVDLALDEVLPDKPAVLVIDKSANPKLWVSFNQASSADIRVTFSGPHSAITDVSRRLREGNRLEFVFDVTQEKMNKPGNYDLRMFPFLQKDNQIKQLGLKVVSCEPEMLNVNVVGLVEKPLTVKCIDENGLPLKAESIEPSTVNMLVPEDWQGEKLNAKALLTRSEINQARLLAIKKIPYIELTTGQRREIAAAVKIKMPPAEDVRKDYTITTATLGFYFSANLQGKYKVQVTNLNEVISPFAIRATPEAKQAYENMRYQVILEIGDEDVKAEEPRREVVYNFPDEFVRRDEIVLNQPRAQARFKLIPVSGGSQ